ASRERRRRGEDGGDGRQATHAVKGRSRGGCPEISDAAVKQSPCPSRGVRGRRKDWPHRWRGSPRGNGHVSCGFDAGSIRRRLTGVAVSAQCSPALGRDVFLSLLPPAANPP